MGSDSSAYSLRSQANTYTNTHTITLCETLTCDKKGTIVFGPLCLYLTYSLSLCRNA